MHNYYKKHETMKLVTPFVSLQLLEAFNTRHSITTMGEFTLIAILFKTVLSYTYSYYNEVAIKYGYYSYIPIVRTCFSSETFKYGIQIRKGVITIIH